ncbi:MAG: hypothetical protein CHACPFDD_03808 [Phycisphaerae bacterium]|nr:hypothetical protein [Phycisphaerae bacterium]
MSDPRIQVEKLRQVLEVTREMGATTDLDLLLHLIIAAARRVLNCERVSIFLMDHARNELYSRVTTTGEEIRFPADAGIAGAAARERRVINVPDAYADARFNRDVDRSTGFRTTSLLTFPLENSEGGLVGVMQTLNKHGGPFDADDEDLGRVLSAQAGVALHRWFLLRQYAEKQRQDRELELAREIQQGLFPDADPSLAGYQIAGWNMPADRTGGDCYDFFSLDDGRLVVLLADATGHGIGAALVIAQCRSIIRAMLSVTDDLRRIAIAVNGILCEDLLDGRFVTAFLGFLDPRRHELTYVSAGQGPVLFVDGGGAVISRPAEDPPLAVIENLAGSMARFEFAPGATLLVATDGFFEALNTRSEQFGTQRVIDHLVAARRHEPRDLLDGLHRAVVAFSGIEPQADDLTAVLIRRCWDVAEPRP